MALLAHLDVALRGDTTGYDKALKGAESRLSQFRQKVDKGGGSGGSLLGAGAAAGLVGAAVTAVIGALKSAGEAIKDWAAEAFESINQVARASQRLGITTDALSALQHGAVVSGSSVETLEHGLEHFTRAISEATHGSAEMNVAFAQLGLNAQELASVPLDQALNKYADGLKGLDTAGDRVRLQMQIMGRGSAELIDTFGKGSAGLKAFRQESDALGRTVTGEQAGKVRLASQSWARFKEGLAAIGQTIAVALAPALTFLGGALSEVAAWFNRVGGPVIKGFVTGLLTSLFTVAYGVDRWKSALSLAVDWVHLAFVSFWEDTKHAFTTVLPGVFLAFLGFFKTWFVNLWENVKSGGKAIWDSLTGKDADFKWKDLTEGWAKALEEMRRIADRPLTDIEKRLAESIKRQSKTIGEGLSVYLKGIFDRLGFGSDLNKGLGKGGPGQQTTQLGGGAVEAGTAEAFQIIAGSQGDKMFSVANKQLEESKKLSALMDLLYKGITKENIKIFKAKLR